MRAENDDDAEIVSGTRRNPIPAVASRQWDKTGGPHNGIDGTEVTGQEGQIRISLVGPSGAGKSTVAYLLQCLVPDAVIIAIAQPMRDIEDRVHEILGGIRPNQRATQDGRLLQEVREMLLTRDPTVLERRFLESLSAASNSSLVVNPDCRQAMHRTLADLGFIFVSINASHSSVRMDSTVPIHGVSDHDEVISADKCQLELLNPQGLDRLLLNIHLLLQQVSIEQ